MSRVAKWGNSLGVRLPQAVVASAGLKEGDEVVIAFDGSGAVTITPDRRRRDAVEALRGLRLKIPDDYKFDREEISRRGADD